jgi:energy-converting hydrogenase Eha subunit G
MFNIFPIIFALGFLALLIYLGILVKRRKWKTMSKTSKVAICIIAFGFFVFLLTPLLLALFNIDSDIIGFLIALIGAAVLLIGYITNRIKRGRIKRR